MVRRFLPITSAACMAALRRVAEQHGYIATRGPRAGQGNPSELIQALDAGELATVLLSDDERRAAITWLTEQASALAGRGDMLGETIRSIADQLHDAARRNYETDGG